MRSFMCPLCGCTWGPPDGLPCDMLCAECVEAGEELNTPMEYQAGDE